MGNRISFWVNGESFKTKKALGDRIRNILWSYSDGDMLSEIDTAFMTEVFAMHPEGECKIGCGIAQIEVRRNPVYTQTQGFWIIRCDGSETDISYLECLTKTHHYKRFERACRVAIEPSIMKFKQFAFDLAGGILVCPLTSEMLTFVGAHVDHIPPKTFKTLLADFVREHGVDVDNIKVDGQGTDGAIQDRLADTALEQIWINYHNAHAALRVVSRSGNLSQSKKGS